jgi:hypothetical protein
MLFAFGSWYYSNRFAAVTLSQTWRQGVWRDQRSLWHGCLLLVTFIGALDRRLAVQGVFTFWAHRGQRNLEAFTRMWAEVWARPDLWKSPLRGESGVSATAERGQRDRRTLWYLSAWCLPQLLALSSLGITCFCSHVTCPNVSLPVATSKFPPRSTPNRLGGNPTARGGENPSFCFCVISWPVIVPKQGGTCFPACRKVLALEV